MRKTDRDHYQKMIDTGEEPRSNPSDNPTFASVLEKRVSRRQVLRGSLNGVVAGMIATSGAGLMANSAAARPGFLPPQANGRPPFGLTPALGFEPVPVNYDNAVRVPAGYSSKPFLPWGEPICGDYPAYLDGGFNTGADQECQMGHNHDGMHYFPIGDGDEANEHGLLVMNHEYIEQNDMHPNGPTLQGGVRVVEDEVRKEVAAHGVSITEIRRSNGEWAIVRGAYNRRITATTPMEIGGPVRGSDMLRTKYSPDGTRTRGTINNCAHGYTPWGTYLTCEENWAGYFVNRGEQPREQSRYGVSRTVGRYRWETVSQVDVYARHDVSVKGNSPTEDYRNEPNTFGWVVEIDPFDPTSTPVKCTALGRFAHEGAWFAPVQNGQPITVYMGDDARFEYIYKFVSKGRYNPRTAGSHLLDEGTLYVARFNDDGSGDWIALDHDNADFQAACRAAGVRFRDQADVLINARTAADVVGATRMDRPEWGAVHPQTREVYMTLTNNSQRQADDTNAANPRGPNFYGQIVRWQEQGNRNWALRFQWDLFVVAGPENDSGDLNGRSLDETNIFNSPDGLWFDDNGVLWIQTDGNQNAPFGNNQMLAADPRTGEIRRFFTGARGCEVTGVVTTPDMKTMFVNVQHPRGNWPDGGSARPRSSTVIVTRDDGGEIGVA